MVGKLWLAMDELGSKKQRALKFKERVLMAYSSKKAER